MPTVVRTLVTTRTGTGQFVGNTVGVDPVTGALCVFEKQDGAIVGRAAVPNVHFQNGSIAVDAAGTPYVVLFSALPTGASTADRPIRDALVTIGRYVTPSIPLQPAPVTAELAADEVSDDGTLAAAEPVAVTFTVGVDGAPAPAMRWQSLTAFGWRDLKKDDVAQEVFTGTLTVQATETLDAAQCRAVLTSGVIDAFGVQRAVGATASDPATLRVSVSSLPVVTSQPVAVTIYAGDDAVFTVEAQGVLGWDQRTDGQWETLVVSELVHIDGAHLRAVLTNDVGTVRSDEVTLTVRTAPDCPTAARRTTSRREHWRAHRRPMRPRSRASRPCNGTGPAASGVRIATFEGVMVVTDNGLTVPPRYIGVEIETPEGALAQNRAVPDWGAWPQSVVDVHQTTGLAACFYSTGGALDPLKTPSPSMPVTGTDGLSGHVRAAGILLLLGAAAFAGARHRSRADV